jgi:hypothetical protein
MNEQNYEIGKVLSGTQGYHISVATDHVQTPLMWIRYLGDTASGATLAIAAGGDMAFTTDGTTADTTVNTTGSIDLSTPAAAVDTIGEVLDMINASANWSVVLLAGLRSMSSDNVFTTVTEVDLSTAAYKTTGAYLYSDAAVTPYTSGVAITGFDPAIYVKGDNPDEGCISYVDYISAYINASGSTGIVRVYSSSQSADTVLFSAVITDATTFTYGSVTAMFPFISSKMGERLMVLAINDQDPSTDVLQVLGHTIDLSGANFKAHRPTNANLA